MTKLTVFAFSSDNWRRPPAEVDALMALFRSYLCNEAERHARKGTRLSRSSAVATACRPTSPRKSRASKRRRATAVGCIFAWRSTIPRATRSRAPSPARSRRASAATRSAGSSRSRPTTRAPDVDLLIRTGGEKRLSDFLLWECAYAELAFLDVMWPEFTPARLAATLADFRRRERRFGGLSPALAEATA